MMRHERLNFHPLVNTRTTGLKSADLVKFLRATGHEPLVAALGQESSRRLNKKPGAPSRAAKLGMARGLARRRAGDEGLWRM